MNTARLESLRKTINNCDLIRAESAIREMGRSAASHWRALPAAVKGDIVAAVLGISSERVGARGSFRITAMEKLRIDRGWSIFTAAHKLVKLGGLRGNHEMLIQSLESAPKRRGEIGREIVHALERLWDAPWEELMASVPIERVEVVRTYQTLDEAWRGEQEPEGAETETTCVEKSEESALAEAV